ncbi:MAG: M20/M25/M40 family metallo-hydrolase [Proteobacteria bacterium]|nr:M20/M25/M40 family metallo-hydrolase [Pseudomonadota bacterium]
MRSKVKTAIAAALVVAGGAVAAATAAAATASAAQADKADLASNSVARALLQQLIDIDTTDAHGNVTTAAQAMAQRFRAAGFPEQDVVIAGGANPKKQNVVIRLHGSGAHKPVLLIGHLDVVDARREDWTSDPFKLIEKDGYFYGRGTQDMKDGDAIMAATLLRMKQEGFRPARDIILALTADEEGGCCNGVDWLLKNRHELVDAEFVLNHDGASVMSEHGVPQVFELGATEKVYADYQLVVTNRGGHSSLPRPDNAIYQLAAGLMRVQAYKFPFELNNVTRAYFESMAKLDPQRAADFRAILTTPPDEGAIARLSQDPTMGSIMRTTCVATRLAGGHGNNALPQRAEANINCRILPGHSPEKVRQQLIRVLNDKDIAVRFVADNGTVTDTAPDREGYPPPPLKPEVMKPLEAVVKQMWPGLAIVPTMSAGASDSIYTAAMGIPSYGIAGVAIDRDDLRMHGRDERVGVASFDRGNEFFYRYLKAVTAR